MRSEEVRSFVPNKGWGLKLHVRSLAFCLLTVCLAPFGHTYSQPPLPDGDNRLLAFFWTVVRGVHPSLPLFFFPFHARSLCLCPRAKKKNGYALIRLTLFFLKAVVGKKKDKRNWAIENMGDTYEGESESERVDINPFLLILLLFLSLARLGLSSCLFVIPIGHLLQDKMRLRTWGMRPRNMLQKSTRESETYTHIVPLPMYLSHHHHGYPCNEKMRRWASVAEIYYLSVFWSWSRRSSHRYTTHELERV